MSKKVITLFFEAVVIFGQNNNQKMKKRNKKQVRTSICRYLNPNLQGKGDKKL